MEMIESIFIPYSLPIYKKDLGLLPTRIHPGQFETVLNKSGQYTLGILEAECSVLIDHNGEHK